MIKVTTNIPVLGERLLRKLEVLRDPKPLLRIVAHDVLVLMDERIHEDGKAADDSRIGDYSSRYLKLRMKKHKHNGDKKVKVVLTRQLRNDWNVIATPNGNWGIGFLNPHNAQKLRWVEEQKNKKIGALAKRERDYAMLKLPKLVKEKMDAIS